MASYTDCRDWNPKWDYLSNSHSQSNVSGKIGTHVKKKETGSPLRFLLKHVWCVSYFIELVKSLIGIKILIVFVMVYVILLMYNLSNN